MTRAGRRVAEKLAGSPDLANTVNAAVVPGLGAVAQVSTGEHHSQARTSGGAAWRPLPSRAEAGG